jgi:hypothetical protein
MQRAVVSLVVMVLLVFQIASVSAQDIKMPYCTQEEALSVFNEFQTLNERIAEKITLPDDPEQYPEYFLYYYDLRDEWWTEKVPLFPECVEIHNASYAFGYAMDQLIMSLGFVNTYFLEVERGNLESASQFQDRSQALGSSELFTNASKNTVNAIEGLYSLAYGSKDIQSAAATVTPIGSSSLPIFADEFADPDMARQFEVSCPNDLYPVFYPIVTDQRPDEAIEFLTAIKVIATSDLSYGDVQINYGNKGMRYPEITIGNITSDDVNTSNELQEKYRRHKLVFIPLSDGEFYRVEHDQSNYDFIWHKVSTADVEELFQILDAPKCLEGLEPYGS